MAVIIFDFDGTIADSRDYFISFIAEQAGKSPLSLQEKHALYGLSLLKIARRLGYHWWSLPGLFINGRRKMGRVMIHVTPFSGMPSVIKKLHAEGHELFIISSNSVKNIRSFLKHNHIRQYFVEVYGGIEVFGKAPMFRQLIRDHQLDISNLICIGDELRDIEAGQSIGARTIAVTWGFAKPSDLVDLKPTAVANKPEELITIIEEI